MNCFLWILTKSDDDFYRYFPLERSKPFVPAFELSADIKRHKSKQNTLPSELKALLEGEDIGTGVRAMMSFPICMGKLKLTQNGLRLKREVAGAVTLYN